jgi:hypothetical protein
MEAGTMGDNIDLRFFVPRAVIFDHIGGIVESKVHYRRVVSSTWMATRCTLPAAARPAAANAIDVNATAANEEGRARRCSSKSIVAI